MSEWCGKCWNDIPYWSFEWIIERISSSIASRWPTPFQRSTQMSHISHLSDTLHGEALLSNLSWLSCQYWLLDHNHIANIINTMWASYWYQAPKCIIYDENVCFIYNLVHMAQTTKQATCVKIKIWMAANWNKQQLDTMYNSTTANHV